MSLEWSETWKPGKVMPIGMESSNGNPPRFVGNLKILIKWLLELVVGDSCLVFTFQRWEHSFCSEKISTSSTEDIRLKRCGDLFNGRFMIPRRKKHVKHHQCNQEVSKTHFMFNLRLRPVLQKHGPFLDDKSVPKKWWFVNKHVQKYLNFTGLWDEGPSASRK